MMGLFPEFQLKMQEVSGISILKKSVLVLLYLLLLYSYN